MTPRALPAPRGQQVVVRAVDLGGRVPPNNPDAEAATLSAMLADRRAIAEVQSLPLHASEFYGDANRRVCAAIFAVHGRGIPVDEQTVAAELRDRDQLSAVGGIKYLSQLIDATPDVRHVAAHAKVVRELARRRRIIETAQQIAAEGYGNEYSHEDFAAYAADAIHRVAAVADDDELTDARTCVREAEERLERIAQGIEVGHGLLTGFDDLDALTGGMHEAEVTVCGARPGVGKTAYALGVVANVTSRPHNGEECGALIFSAEMKRAQLTLRMASAESGIDGRLLRRGVLTPAQREYLTAAHARIEKLPWWVHECPDPTPSLIRAHIQRLQAKYDAPGKRRLRLVVVDYLTICKPDEYVRGMSREQVVGDIAQSLRKIAKETGVHILELAQLKQPTTSPPAPPTLGDLRESGQIEQAAHAIFFLHRPEMYAADPSDVPEEHRGICGVSLQKCRDGATGNVRLRYTGRTTRFDNCPD